ncbi:MAG: glycosyltransferase family 4 protein [Candidatus Saccharimonadales bacterium]
MKIAIVAPVEEVVPPQKYGGIERVVSVLTEQLVVMGHDVTLFASGDSKTNARLVPMSERAIRTLPESKSMEVRKTYMMLGMNKFLNDLQDNDYDVVHNHVSEYLLMVDGLIKPPVVTTLHGPLNSAFEKLIYGTMPEANYVSISHSQRKPMPDLNYVANVHNAINTDEFDFYPNQGDYLAFLGRISPEKGPIQAINIAKKSGYKLIMGAKVDPQDAAYFEEEVKPLIDGDQIVFLGEIDHAQKVDLLGNAKAMLAPIQWEEPFGMYYIESLACGTPVATIGRGSVPEIITDKVHGIVCSNADEIIERLGELDDIDRKVCRQQVEKNFSAKQMGTQYLDVYQKVIDADLRATDHSSKEKDAFPSSHPKS